MKTRLIKSWQKLESSNTTAPGVTGIDPQRLNTLIAILGKDDNVGPSVFPSGWVNEANTASAQSQVWLNIMSKEVSTNGQADEDISWTTDSEEQVVVVFELEGVDHSTISTPRITSGSDALPINNTAWTAPANACVLIAGFVADGYDTPQTLDPNLYWISNESSGTGSGSAMLGVGYANFVPGNHRLNINTIYSNVYANTTGAGGYIEFSADGLKCQHGSGSGITLYESRLTVAWDMSTATAYGSADFTGANRVYGFKWIDSGNKMLMIQQRADGDVSIHTYSVGTPYDMFNITAALKGETLFDANENYDVVMSPDGLELWAGNDSGNIIRYTMSAAWDIDTLTLTADTFPINAEECMFFSDSGKLFSVLETNYIDASSTLISKVLQYDLKTAYDIASWDGFESKWAPAHGFAYGEPHYCHMNAAGTRIVTTSTTHMAGSVVNGGGRKLLNGITSADEWINYDFYIEAEQNDSPTVVLNSPADAGTADVAPKFEFTGTDVDGDDITYELQINKANRFEKDNYYIKSAVSNNNAATSLYLGSTERAGQCFYAQGGFLRSAWFHLQWVGGAGLAQVVAEVWSSTGTYGSTAVPDTLIATSSTARATNTLTTTWEEYEFEFAELPFLEPGQVYFLCIYFPFQNSSSYIQVAGRTGSLLHDGNSATYTGTTWTAQSYDIWFRTEENFPVQVISDLDTGFFRTGDTDPFTSGQLVEYNMPNVVAEGVLSVYSTSVNTESLISASRDEHGQTFTADYRPLGVVSWKLARTGTAVAENLYTHLYATSGGLPTGSPIATSLPVVQNTIGGTAAWADFIFESLVPLTDGNVYALVLDVSSLALSEAITIDTNDAGSAAGTTVYRLAGGSWTSEASTDTIHIFYSGFDLRLQIPHYWRVRGIDPLGTNREGEWSEVRSFTPVDKDITVALNSPADTATTSITGTLKFTGTDSVDASDITYEIELDNVSALFNNLIVLENSLNSADSFTRTADSDPFTSGQEVTWESDGVEFLLDAQTIGGSSVALYSGSVEAVSQSWIPPNIGFDSKVDICKFYVAKVGSPTGNVYAEIWEHSGTYGTSSVPSTLLGTSDAVDAASISATPGLQTFSFTGANLLTLAKGSNKTIVLRYDTGGDASNYIDAHYTASDFHNGNMAQFNGTWSAQASNDLRFEIRGHRILVDAATYYWRVRGKDPAKAEVYGDWSAVRSFTATAVAPLLFAASPTASVTSSDVTTVTIYSIAANIAASADTSDATATQTSTFSFAANIAGSFYEGEVSRIASELDVAYGNFDIIGTTGKSGQVILGNGGTLDEATFSLDNFAVTTGLVHIYVYSIGSGTYGTDAKPGTQLAKSVGQEPYAWTQSLKTFVFTGADRITLENGTPYWIGAGQEGSNNSIIMDGGASTPTLHPGNIASYNGTIWTGSNTHDMLHRIQTLDGTAVELTISVSGNQTADPGKADLAITTYTPATSINRLLAATAGASITTSDSAAAISIVASSINAASITTSDATLLRAHDFASVSTGSVTSADATVLNNNGFAALIAASNTSSDISVLGSLDFAALSAAAIGTADATVDLSQLFYGVANASFTSTDAEALGSLSFASTSDASVETADIAVDGNLEFIAATNAAIDTADIQVLGSLDFAANIAASKTSSDATALGSLSFATISAASFGTADSVLDITGGEITSSPGKADLTITTFTPVADFVATPSRVELGAVGWFARSEVSIDTFDFAATINAQVDTSDTDVIAILSLASANNAQVDTSDVAASISIELLASSDAAIDTSDAEAIILVEFAGASTASVDTSDITVLGSLDFAASQAASISTQDATVINTMEFAATSTARVDSSNVTIAAIADFSSVNTASVDTSDAVLLRSNSFSTTNSASVDTSDATVLNNNALAASINSSVDTTDAVLLRSHSFAASSTASIDTSDATGDLSNLFFGAANASITSSNAEALGLLEFASSSDASVSTSDTVVDGLFEFLTTTSASLSTSDISVLGLLNFASASNVSVDSSNATVLNNNSFESLTSNAVDTSDAVLLRDHSFATTSAASITTSDTLLKISNQNDLLATANASFSSADAQVEVGRLFAASISGAISTDDIALLRESSLQAISGAAIDTSNAELVRDFALASITNAQVDTADAFAINIIEFGTASSIFTDGFEANDWASWNGGTPAIDTGSSYSGASSGYAITDNYFKGSQKSLPERLDAAVEDVTFTWYQSYNGNASDIYFQMGDSVNSNRGWLVGITENGLEIHYYSGGGSNNLVAVPSGYVKDNWYRIEFKLTADRIYFSSYLGESSTPIYAQDFAYAGAYLDYKVVDTLFVNAGPTTEKRIDDISVSYGASGGVSGVTDTSDILATVGMQLTANASASISTADSILSVGYETTANVNAAIGTSDAELLRSHDLLSVNNGAVDSSNISVARDHSFSTATDAQVETSDVFVTLPFSTTPDRAQLAISVHAPVISKTEHVVVSPANADLTITSYIPGTNQVTTYSIESVIAGQVDTADTVVAVNRPLLSSSDASIDTGDISAVVAISIAGNSAGSVDTANADLLRGHALLTEINSSFTSVDIALLRAHALASAADASVDTADAELLRAHSLFASSDAVVDSSDSTVQNDNSFESVVSGSVGSDNIDLLRDHPLAANVTAQVDSDDITVKISAANDLLASAHTKVDSSTALASISIPLTGSADSQVDTADTLLSVSRSLASTSDASVDTADAEVLGELSFAAAIDSQVDTSDAQALGELEFAGQSDSAISTDDIFVDGLYEFSATSSASVITGDAVVLRDHSFASNSTSTVGSSDASLLRQHALESLNNTVVSTSDIIVKAQAPMFALISTRVDSTNSEVTLDRLIASSIDSQIDSFAADLTRDHALSASSGASISSSDLPVDGTLAYNANVNAAVSTSDVEVLGSLDFAGQADALINTSDAEALGSLSFASQSDAAIDTSDATAEGLYEFASTENSTIDTQDIAVVVQLLVAGQSNSSIETSDITTDGAFSFEGLAAASILSSDNILSVERVLQTISNASITSSDATPTLADEIAVNSRISASIASSNSDLVLDIPVTGTSAASVDTQDILVVVDVPLTASHNSVVNSSNAQLLREHPFESANAASVNSADAELLRNHDLATTENNSVVSSDAFVSLGMEFASDNTVSIDTQDAQMLLDTPLASSLSTQVDSSDAVLLREHPFATTLAAEVSTTDVSVKIVSENGLAATCAVRTDSDTARLDIERTIASNISTSISTDDILARLNIPVTGNANASVDSSSADGHITNNFATSSDGSVDSTSIDITTTSIYKLSALCSDIVASSDPSVISERLIASSEQARIDSSDATILAGNDLGGSASASFNTSDVFVKATKALSSGIISTAEVTTSYGKVRSLDSAVENTTDIDYGTLATLKKVGSTVEATIDVSPHLSAVYALNIFINTVGEITFGEFDRTWNPYPQGPELFKVLSDGGTLPPAANPNAPGRPKFVSDGGTLPPVVNPNAPGGKWFASDAVIYTSTKPKGPNSGEII